MSIKSGRQDGVFALQILTLVFAGLPCLFLAIFCFFGVASGMLMLLGAMLNAGHRMLLLSLFMTLASVGGIIGMVGLVQMLICMSQRQPLSVSVYRFGHIGQLAVVACLGALAFLTENFSVALHDGSGFYAVTLMMPLLVSLYVPWQYARLLRNRQA